MVEDKFQFRESKMLQNERFSIIIAEYVYHPYHSKIKFWILKLLNSSEFRISSGFFSQNSITMVEKTLTFTMGEEINTLRLKTPRLKMVLNIFSSPPKKKIKKNAPLENPKLQLSKQKKLLSGSSYKTPDKKVPFSDPPKTSKPLLEKPETTAF